MRRPAPSRRTKRSESALSRLVRTRGGPRPRAEFALGDSSLHPPIGYLAQAWSGLTFVRLEEPRSSPLRRCVLSLQRRSIRRPRPIPSSATPAAPAPPQGDLG